MGEVSKGGSRTRQTTGSSGQLPPPTRLHVDCLAFVDAQTEIFNLMRSDSFKVVGTDRVIRVIRVVRATRFFQPRKERLLEVKGRKGGVLEEEE